MALFEESTVRKLVSPVPRNYILDEYLSRPAKAVARSKSTCNSSLLFARQAFALVA